MCFLSVHQLLEDFCLKNRHEGFLKWPFLRFMEKVSGFECDSNTWIHPLLINFSELPPRQATVQFTGSTFGWKKHRFSRGTFFWFRSFRARTLRRQELSLVTSFWGCFRNFRSLVKQTNVLRNDSFGFCGNFEKLFALIAQYTSRFHFYFSIQRGWKIQNQEPNLTEETAWFVALRFGLFQGQSSWSLTSM